MLGSQAEQDREALTPAPVQNPVEEGSPGSDLLEGSPAQLKFSSGGWGGVGGVGEVRSLLGSQTSKPVVVTQHGAGSSCLSESPVGLQKRQELKSE